MNMTIMNNNKAAPHHYDNDDNGDVIRPPNNDNDTLLMMENGIQTDVASSDETSTSNHHHDNPNHNNTNVMKDNNNNNNNNNEYEYELQPAKWLCLLQIMVLGILLSLTALGGAGTYYFITLQEKEPQEQQRHNNIHQNNSLRRHEFEIVTNTIINSIQQNVISNLDMYQSMALHITTYSLLLSSSSSSSSGTTITNNETENWPEVTIPHFQAEVNSILGRKRKSSTATTVTLQTLVTEEQRNSWEQYITNQPTTTSSSSSFSEQSRYNQITPLQQYHLGQGQGQEPYYYYAPISHVASSSSSSSSSSMDMNSRYRINYNAFNYSYFPGMFDKLLQETTNNRNVNVTAVVSQIINWNEISTATTATTTTTNSALPSSLSSSSRTSTPETCIAIPVYKNLHYPHDGGQAVPSSLSSLSLVAVLTIYQPWHEYFLNPLPLPSSSSSSLLTATNSPNSIANEGNGDGEDDGDEDDVKDSKNSILLYLVIRNTCEQQQQQQQEMTYSINEQMIVNFLGPGNNDYHDDVEEDDENGDDLVVVVNVKDFITTTSSSRMMTLPPPTTTTTEDDCQFSLSFFPSKEFLTIYNNSNTIHEDEVKDKDMDDDSSVRSLRYTASVTGVLFTIAITFCLYGCGRTADTDTTVMEKAGEGNKKKNNKNNTKDETLDDNYNHHEDDDDADDNEDDFNCSDGENFSSRYLEDDPEPSVALELALATTTTTSTITSKPPSLRNNSRAFSDALLSISSNGGDGGEGTDDVKDGHDTGPASFADNFKNSSVMFADIDGFQTWSAIREPSQVFILLAAAYSAFDRIADARNIFKVETLGDCYVGAAGLPDQIDDHATVIVRFADDCMKEMKDVASQLAETLGPGTADLSLRVGIHSGPVVAGVLKGEGKYRFQLLGDAVQIAALMLSTSFKNKIHTSPETARLLIEDDKSDWLKPRYSTVFIKDKESQTYWVSLGNDALTDKEEKRHFSNYDMAKQELKEASSNANIGGAEVVAVSNAAYRGRRSSVGMSSRRSMGMDGSINEAIAGVQAWMKSPSPSSHSSVPHNLIEDAARSISSPNPMQSSPRKFTSPNPRLGNVPEARETHGDSPRHTHKSANSGPRGTVSIVTAAQHDGLHVSLSQASNAATENPSASKVAANTPTITEKQKEKPMTSTKQDEGVDNPVFETSKSIEEGNGLTCESKPASIASLNEMSRTNNGGGIGSVPSADDGVEDYSVSMSEESDSFGSSDSSEDYSSDDDSSSVDDELAEIVAISQGNIKKNSPPRVDISGPSQLNEESYGKTLQELHDGIPQASQSHGDFKVGRDVSAEPSTPNLNANRDHPSRFEVVKRLPDHLNTIEKSVEILRSLLKGIVILRTAKGPEDVLTSWEEDESDSKRRITVQDDVQEVLTFPQQNECSMMLDPSSLELDSAVEMQLRDFVKVVASAYQDHPYHSFERAVAIMESVRKLFSQIVTPNSFDQNVADDTGLSYRRKADPSKLLEFTIGLSSDPLVPFTVAMSALVQDICHPGTNSSRKVTGKASLEYAWDLLLEPTYKDLRACIYTSISERDRFRQLLVNSVVAADLGDKDLAEFSKMRWGKAFRRKASKDANSTTAREEVDLKTTMLLEHLIQAANVSYALNDWLTFTKWVQLHLHELSLAEIQSEEFHIEELNFLDRVVLPLIRRLRECDALGAASVDYLKAARQNRQEWSRKGQELIRNSLTK